ncbi:MAG: hypothetical protein ABFD08_11415 [Syntrophomonas sp.]
MADYKDNLTTSFEVMEKAMEKAWDMWRKGINSFTTAQEQIESITRKQLDQNKNARDEFVKMEDSMQKQIYHNQEQLQKMVQEAVSKAYAQAEKTNQDMAAALNGQVDVMMTQMKQNHNQMQNMIKETVLNTYLQSEKNQYDAIANLTNQVEALTKKMINLSGQIKKITKNEEDK